MVAIFRVYRDPRPKLLREAIDIECSELRSTRNVTNGCRPSWNEEAGSCLAEAEKALNVSDLDRGWALVHQARRLRVFGYCSAEVVAEVRYLRAEMSSGKFKPWRRRAITTQLIPAIEMHDGRWKHSLSVRQVSLFEALTTRDQSYETEYFDLACLRRYQAILVTVALGILLLALGGSVFANPRFEGGVEKGWIALAAALSGALGGITSALQRTTRRSSERRPQKIASLVASLSRPVIGAVAGVSVFLAVRAGITQTSEQQVAYLLLVAFGAGFAERLVVRDPREEASERTPTPTEVHGAKLKSGPLDDDNGPNAIQAEDPGEAPRNTTAESTLGDEQ